MAKRIWYPNIEEIKAYNKLMIENFRVTKAEKHEVLSENKIRIALNKSKQKKGSVEDKAAILMKELNQLHPFASGNKRSAFFAANKMIWCNHGKGLAIKRAKQSEFAKRIRAHNVPEEEISKFLGKC